MPLQNPTIEKINDNVYVVTETGSCNIGMNREKLIAFLLNRCRIEGIPYVEFRHQRNIESIIHYLNNKPE